MGIKKSEVGQLLRAKNITISPKKKLPVSLTIKNVSKSKDEEEEIVEKPTTTKKTKETNDCVDHTRCYVERASLGRVHDHICRGIEDIFTGKIYQKCIHCRFFMPMPKIKEEK